MTNLELADYYITTIEAFYPSLQPMEGYKNMAHCLWMLYQMKDTAAMKTDTPADREKWCRWLGFVQGVIWWATELASIEELRDQTRDLTWGI